MIASTGMSGFVVLVRFDGADADPALFERLTAALRDRGGEIETWSGEGAAVASAGGLQRAGEGRYVVAGDTAPLPLREVAGLAVERLAGEFAYVVWDRRERSLFCARDRFGVRSLCYARLGESWIVSNDLGVLASIGELTGELDEESIADFLLCGVKQDVTRTFFTLIRRVAPAHAITIAAGGVKASPYWSLPIGDAPMAIGEREAVGQFRDLFTEAVRRRAHAGRIVISMSGGIDSTSIAAVLAHLKKRGEIDAQLTALTGAAEDDPEPAVAAVVAGALAIPHVLFRSDAHPPFDCRGVEPPGHPFRASALAFAAVAAEHGTLLMKGDGGDDVLYTSHGHFSGLLRRLQWVRAVREAAAYAISRRRRPPLNLRAPLLRALGRPPWEPQYPRWIRPDFERAAATRERWRAIIGPPAVHPWRPEAHRRVTSPFWPAMFQGLDPAEMRQALHVTAPFFDVALVEFLFSLPPMPHFADKDILREAMRGLLPEAVRRRVKTPLRRDPVDDIPRGAERRRQILAAVPEIDRWVDRSILLQEIEREDIRGFSRAQQDFAVLLAGWLAARKEETGRP